MRLLFWIDNIDGNIIWDVTVVSKLGWFSGWLFVWIKMEENGLLWLGGVILREKKIVEDNQWNFSQDVDCWEIAWNSVCDLKIQLGFLVEEGKFNLGFLCVGWKFIFY